MRGAEEIASGKKSPRASGGWLNGDCPLPFEVEGEATGVEVPVVVALSFSLAFDTASKSLIDRSGLPKAAAARGVGWRLTWKHSEVCMFFLE